MSDAIERTLRIIASGGGRKADADLRIPLNQISRAHCELTINGSTVTIRDLGSSNGTFVNGFYESWPIIYGEEAFGFAKTGQTILNVTDSKIIKLYIDDEPFYLPTANLLSFDRKLDIKTGTLDREVLWETPAGKQIAIKSRRLVSLQQRHLAAISYEVTVLNAEAPVTISSEMVNDNTRRGNGRDPRRARGFAHRALFPRAHYANDARVILSHVTQNSKMTLACGIEHTLDTACPYSYKSDCGEDSGKVVFAVEAKPGQLIRLVKYMTYHTSDTASAAELRALAEQALDRAVEHGFDELLVAQRAYLDDFWHRSDVEFRGDPAVANFCRERAGPERSTSCFGSSDSGSSAGSSKR